jgi:hypothetical protein
VSEPRLNIPGKILAFASVVEVGTGLVLMIDPVIVVTLLLGTAISAEGMLLGRCFGIALLALGLACWPGQPHAESGSPAFRAMLTYNGLIALYLAYLGTVGHVGGLLLWPGVALHAVVALLLVWTWRDERRTKAIHKKGGRDSDELRSPLYYEFRDVLETFGVLACFKTPYLEGTPGSSDWMPCPPLGHQARAVDFCSSRSPSMEDRTVSSARLAGSLHSQG